MIKKISISTTTHLCNNPRLVKELSSLSALRQYHVEVIYFQFNYEKAKHDQEIIDKIPHIKFRPIYWYSKSRSRLFYSLVSKILIAINRYLKISISPEQQIFPGYFKLFQILKKSNAHIYHGHNLGALAATINVATLKNKKAIFDAEDFHRGETHPPNLVNKLTISIEDKYIPQLKALISASPLIKKEYQKLYPQISHININNVFHINNHIKNSVPNAKLNCVWFSQVVGLDRGLQDVIQGINAVNIGGIKLDIIGSINERTKQTLLELLQNPLHEVNFISPLSTLELDNILVNYEIGIASETSPNYNREICLTNKIFQYINAGLAILASNTTAQKDLMEEAPNIGYIYPMGNTAAIKKILGNWIMNPQLLNKNRDNAKEISKSKYNWEIEQKKFLGTLENVI